MFGCAGSREWGPSQRYPVRYGRTMKRLWVTWSRQRFTLTFLPVVAALIAARVVLLREVESQVVEIALHGAFLLTFLVIGYAVFTWAAEYDRRNPRDYTQ